MEHVNQLSACQKFRATDKKYIQTVDKGKRRGKDSQQQQQQ